MKTQLFTITGSRLHLLANRGTCRWSDWYIRLISDVKWQRREISGRSMLKIDVGRVGEVHRRKSMKEGGGGVMVWQHTTPWTDIWLDLNCVLSEVEIKRKRGGKKKRRQVAMMVAIVAFSLSQAKERGLTWHTQASSEEGFISRWFCYDCFCS